MRKRILLWLPLALAALCLILAAAAYASNLGLPERSINPERLNEASQAMIQESIAVRRALGEAVWPGFAGASIPVIAYNERNAFLTGDPDPAPGWIKVPETDTRGGPWQPVEDEQFAGEPYFYQPVSDASRQIGSFTVLVGERWTAALIDAEWGRISLRSQFKADLPPLIGDLIPYRLVLPWFLNTDNYVFKLAHESFHAFQGQSAPDKLIEAENAVRLQESSYPWEAEPVQELWQEEFQLLEAALRADTADEARTAAQEFLKVRNQRRTSPIINAAQIKYEQLREWLEGLALYAELNLWKQAFESQDYQPGSAIRALDDFNHYKGFPRTWSSTLTGMPNQAKQQDSRFYVSGMAQAMLLDRLMPGWKARAMQPDVYLDQLLAEALQVP